MPIEGDRARTRMSSLPGKRTGLTNRLTKQAFDKSTPAYANDDANDEGMQKSHSVRGTFDLNDDSRLDREEMSHMKRTDKEQHERVMDADVDGDGGERERGAGAGVKECGIPCW